MHGLSKIREEIASVVSGEPMRPVKDLDLADRPDAAWHTLAARLLGEELGEPRTMSHMSTLSLKAMTAPEPIDAPIARSD